MKRSTKSIVPDLILTADWHLRADTPLCRAEDEFQSAQWEKVQFVKRLQKRYGCPVINAGDLFNHWKPSPWLLSKTIQHLPADFKVIYGNHDLPQHSIPDQDKSGIYTLKTGLQLELLDGVHWGEKPEQGALPSFSIQYGPYDTDYRSVLVWHTMTYQGLNPWPGFKGPKAGGLLRKYSDYDLILTGHNHKAFVETHDGRILVNPGSLTRHDADQIDFRPRVYLYYAATNTVKPVYLPIEEGVVSRAHIERDSKRSGRIDAFISKLSGEFQAGMSFEKNMELFFENNKVRKATKEICHKAMEA